MANIKVFNNELFSDVVKSERGKANTLGPDANEVSEPFGKTRTGILSDIWRTRPSISGGLITPEYDDSPSEGSVGTRYVTNRLHSFLPSGKTGPASCQTFLCVSSAPTSHNPENIESVRIKHLVSPEFSANKSDASHSNPNERGFQLALYPAKTTSGAGTPLEADTTSGPIPITADPSATYGMGSEYWYVDYADGIVRLSAAPTTGSNYLFNPNSVYGDIDGNEVASDAYGAITLFATFYKHTGTLAESVFNNQFVTVGDGVNSEGSFSGTGSNTFQSAVDYVKIHGGGTVFVKDGYYDFTDGYYVDVGDDVELRALNNVFIKSAEQQAIFRVSGSNVRIHNFNFEIASGASTVPSSAVQISGKTNGQTVENVLIENCNIFIDADAYGIAFYPESNETIYQNIKISNNTFRDDTSSGLPIASENSFIGLVTPTLEQDLTTYDVIFKDININNNVFKCTQTNSITMVADFATIDGLYVSDNKEITGGNSRINIRFKSNDNVYLNNNIMPYSDVVIYNGRLSQNKFLSTSLTTSNSPNEFYGSPAIKAYGKGNLCLMGGIKTSGVILLYSYDGLTWFNNTSGYPYSHEIKKIINNGKDRWVIFGSDGQAAVSDDGFSWSELGYILNEEVYSAAYGNGLWIVGGASGGTATSLDGITWTRQADLFGGSAVNTIVCDNTGTFLASSNSANQVIKSTDGVNWTTVSSLIGFNDIATDGRGLWVGDGRRTSINNGTTWVYQPKGQDAVSTAYNGHDLWVSLSSDGVIKTSPDAVHWRQQTDLYTVIGSFYKIVYNNGVWIVGGQAANYISTDGVHWTTPSFTSVVPGIYDICAKSSNAGLISTGSNGEGSGVIGVGQGNCAYGIEGFGDGYGSGVKAIGGDLGGPGLTAIGGGFGVRSYAPHTKGFSAPGIVAYGGPDSAGIDAYGRGDAYGVAGVGGENNGSGVYGKGNGEGFGVVGEGSSGVVGYAYEDGYGIAGFAKKAGVYGRSTGTGAGVVGEGNSTYRACGVFGYGYPGVTGNGIEESGMIGYGGSGLWCIVGNNGTILTSTDGVSWVSRSSSGSNFLSIEHDGKDLWIITGEDTNILYSKDTITWDSANISGFVGSDVIRSVCYNGFLWNASSGISEASSIMFSSADGVNWYKTQNLGLDDRTFIGFDGKNTLICCGSFSDNTYISYDGVNWENLTVNYFTSIGHNGKDLWAGIDRTDVILTSPNGRTWTIQKTISGLTDYANRKFGAIAHNKKDRWVVVGRSGMIYSSQNGSTWTQHTADNSYVGDFTSVYYNGKLWVITGETGEIQISYDGVNWQHIDISGITTENLNQVKFIKNTNCGGYFVGGTGEGTGVVSVGSDSGNGIVSVGDGYGSGIKSYGGYLGGPGLIAFGGGNETLLRAPKTTNFYAPGVIAYGGPYSSGLDGYGGRNNGAGVVGFGGYVNGAGVVGFGQGSGAGAIGTGGISDGYGIIGIAQGNGQGVVGYSSGTGSGIIGIATGTGYGVVAQGNDDPATRSSLRLVPQGNAPSTKAEGDMYYNYNTHKAYIWDGSTWQPLW